jgi:hypothetical protein
LALALGVLRIQPRKTIDPNTTQAVEWKKVKDHVADLCSRYANELGENTYAVFNVITDFASHPPVNSHLQRDRHSLQRLVGKWLGSFAQRYREPGFSLDGYLKELSAAKVDDSFYQAGAIERAAIAAG